ncbi:hypothetical protein AB3S75_002835 [Citrus x aurantiifolia]
MVLTQT